MFVNNNLAAQIAEIFYDSDCSIRSSIQSGEDDYDERAYLGALFKGAGSELKTLGIRSQYFSISHSARSNHTYDGYIIFRVDETVKVGFCESKLLRLYDFFNETSVSTTEKTWDKREKDKSHFYKQIKAFENGDKKIYKWIMFMLSMKIGQQRQNLDKYGSSCVWHKDINDYCINKQVEENHIWTYQDVMNIGKPPLKDLKEIIFELLTGENSFLINQNDTVLEIKGKSTPLRLPLPKRNALNLKKEKESVEKIMTEQKIGSLGIIDI